MINPNITPGFILEWIEFAENANSTSQEIIYQVKRMLAVMPKPQQNSRTYPGTSPDQTCENIIPHKAAIRAAEEAK